MMMMMMSPIRIFNVKVKCLVPLLFIVLVTAADDAPPQALGTTTQTENAATNAQAERKLSETVKAIIDHYKQPDPLGIPGAPIPDPMDIPNMKQSLSIGRMEFKNVKLYGLKKFRIEHVVADINAMKVETELSIDVLHVVGNYTLSTWFSGARGPFNVNLTKVNVIAVATLEVERNGSLEAQAMDMDIHFKDIAMNFEGLGFFANMFQGVMNSVGTFVFDSIKPFVLSEANNNMRNDVNKEIHKLPKKFPNSISPFDEIVCELRRKVRGMGFDPYKVPDYNNTAGIFDVYLTNTWVFGLSSFHRTKDIIFEMKNKMVHAFLEIGTGKLKGQSNWEVSFATGILGKVGTVDFTVDYFKVQVNLSQSMDTRHPPSLDDVQLELGNIQIRFDGLGTVDYLVEFGVNVLPNLLRYQLMDALEKPLKLKIQESLDQVNVELLIRENAAKLDDVNALEVLGSLE